ncbi:MAG TPA: hypothetical protein VGG75_15980 [Trebonia sp.]|jgi:hypothetical protein
MLALDAQFAVVGGIVGMTPDEARDRLRQVEKLVVNLADCPKCKVPQGRRCPCSPEYFNSRRFHRALAEYKSRHGRYPSEDFGRIAPLLFTAFPSPPAAEPEITADGLTVLWRAEVTRDPWFGRGSHWTHDRAWAETFLHTRRILDPRRLTWGLWRAEAVIADEDTAVYEDGRLDMTTSGLDEYIRDNPDWPGYGWLIFTGHPQDDVSLPDESRLVQYVWCGTEPLKVVPAAAQQETPHFSR